MKSIEQWFSEYGESHRHKTNVYIHKVCVPLIMFSILGMLWTAPRMEAFVSPWINWATLFAGACMIFYLTLGVKPTIVMLFEVSLMCFVAHSIYENTSILFSLCLSIFIVAWIFQFIGHKIEGKKPSFFKDLQFLLVGPLWVSKEIFFRDMLPKKN
ncbi:MAG: DUF962 domain-containing protein [Halobacteriovoraceae bacterium]|nr:DUF962 domain-containing protein [Halobacteriovoraceae bacterium]MCB9094032.1 DUF962 domain-containing protein [Halobacteriovoraceae bacterium]